MILFFRKSQQQVFAAETSEVPGFEDIQKLSWLFGNATHEKSPSLPGYFIGPRKEMITPWSTNAVEITQNMAIPGIRRIEEFFAVEDEDAEHDPMLQRLYRGLDQEVFTINRRPDPVLPVEDIAAYNRREGLALSDEEVAYLEGLSARLGRKLTDSEVFGFSQVNSEHCRHQIFNGNFIIDGKEMPDSLFSLIKKTSKTNPNRLVSAYKDNVAFVGGPQAEQFAPETQDKPDFFRIDDIDTVLSLKAETHNFPTWNPSTAPPRAPGARSATGWPGARPACRCQAPRSI